MTAITRADEFSTPGPGRPRLPVVAFSGVVVLAAVLRFAVYAASRGGFSGNVGYDQGVYYNAADALIYGRLPYRDFTLIHPPGLMLALTPFAALGRLTTDHTGFVVANVAFTLLGALNAGLIVLIARRIGFGLRAAVIGGVFYAFWYGAIIAEYTLRLEPLGTFAFLIGLLCLVRVREQRVRWTALGGVGLGLALSVKIWWAIPVLVVVAWVLLARPGRRHLTALISGLAGTAILICAPFFLAAPRDMFRMVIIDQLGRHHETLTWNRLDDFTTLHAAFPHLSTPLVTLMLTVLGVLFFGLCVFAWQTPGGRFPLVLCLAQLLVLLASPSYFAFYASYPAGALSLSIAAAAQPSSRTSLLQLRTATPYLALALSAFLTLGAFANHPGSLPFPAHRLAAAVSSVRCVMADSPFALIQMDVLSRDLAHGCPNWVDVTGRTYDVDSPTNSKDPSRPANHRWQHAIYRYLRAGGAFILAGHATGLSATTRARLRRYPVLISVDGFTIRRVPHPVHLAG